MPRRVVSSVLVVAVALLLAIPVLHAEPVALKTTELGRGPTLVFVHSMGLTRSDWLTTARKLLSGYRVVLVDRPGHGESPMPDPFSFVTAGEALDAVLARQNPDSTIVIGHQMGGRVAMAALAAHPERARGLLLIDVPVGMSVQIDDQQKKMFLNYMDTNYEQVSRMMFSRMGRDTTQSQQLYAMISATPAVTMKAYVRETFYSDGYKDAKALKLPVRVFATDGTWEKGTTSGAVLKRLGWEDTTLTVTRIADAGAWFMKDQPDSVAARVREFTAAMLAGAKR
ncbi:MAG: alpha/beta fold hydrolase [bacterium]